MATRRTEALGVGVPRASQVRVDFTDDAGNEESLTSIAGSVVEVLEGLDGRLSVQHEGRTVASQQAPPRPGILRSFGTRTVHTTGLSSYTNRVIRRSEDEVAPLGTMLEADRLRDDADRNGAARVRKTVTTRPRKPTPLQTAVC